MRYKELTIEEVEKLSSFERFAYNEMIRAGLFDEDADYDGLVADSVMQLIHTIGEQPHSGASFRLVLTLFTRLAELKPITPLTGEDNEWTMINVNQALFRSDKHLYQNKRCSTVFKSDNKAWDVDAENPNENITFPYHAK